MLCHSQKDRRRKNRLAAGSIIVVAAFLMLVVWPMVRSGALNGVSSRGMMGTGPKDMLEASGLLEALGPAPNDDKVIEAIKDPNLPGRLLAIEFLGEGGYGDALPVLEHIVRSPDESTAARESALESVFLIAEHRGRWLAEEFQRHPLLKSAAQRILNHPDAIRNRPSRCRALIGLVQ